MYISVVNENNTVLVQTNHLDFSKPDICHCLSVYVALHSDKIGLHKVKTSNVASKLYEKNAEECNNDLKRKICGC